MRVVVRLVVVLLVGVLSGLAVFFWMHTERATVDQFQRSSLILARLGAKRVEAIFVRIEKHLSNLSGPACFMPGGGGRCPVSAEEVLAELRPLGAVELFRTNETGGVSATVAFDAQTVEGIFKRALGSCEPEQTLCFGLTDGSSRLFGTEQLALVSLEQKRGRGGRSGSRVAAIFDWNMLGELVNAEVALDPKGLAWILDQDGRLLYHPSNPDVCNEGVQRTDERCHVCHKGSMVSGKMLTGEPGVGAIDVEGSVRKLVAFSSLMVGGRRWSLAVAAPYTSVVAGNRRVLILAILISSVLIGLFLLVTYFLDRENRRQIAALSENQETIHRLNTELETKVRDRTLELYRLYNEISDFRRKHESRERLAIIGELAAMVAHEIRTPLNSLAIGSERLDRKLRADSDINLQEAREMVRSQIFEVRRINEYIEQYLKLARLPRRRLVRSDLNKLVGDLTKFLEVEGERLGVRLHFGPFQRPVVAEIDEDQIRQVLLNLIVNAFQAMPGGGDLYAETESQDDHVTILISDTGVGIAKEQIDDVFKPFFTTREGGTGLGLAICARIVSEHHGSLVCESEVGHGTAFRIELPVVSPDEDSRESDRARR